MKRNISIPCLLLLVVFSVRLASAQTINYLGSLSSDPATCSTSTPTKYWNTVTNKFRNCAGNNKWADEDDTRITTRIDARYASIPTAIANAGSNPTILEILDGSQADVISSSLTVPANVHLKFGAKGYLNIDDDVTVTIEDGAAMVIDSKAHTFRGLGKVLFNKSMPETIYPEWFGAKGDGTTDDLVTFNKIIAAVKYVFYGGDVRAAKIYLASGKTYYLSDAWNVDVPIWLTTTARVGGILKFAPNKSGIILHNLNTLNGTDNGRESSDSIIENVILSGNGGNYTFVKTHDVNVSGLTVTKTSGVNFDGVSVFPETIININNYPYRIESRVSTTQVTIKKPLLRFYAAPVGATTLSRIYSDNIRYPTGGDWTGKTLTINGVNYTVSGATADTVTISTPLTTAAEFGELSGVTATGGSAVLMNHSGIILFSGSTIRNCEIARFAGDGIRISASTFGGVIANANNSKVLNNYVHTNFGNGLLTQGQDANQISISSNDFSYSGGSGIVENSFLGNVYTGNHTSGNWLGSRRGFVGGNVNQSLWTGEYAEADQPGDFFSGNNLVVQGVYGRAFDSTSQSAVIYGAGGFTNVNKFRANNAINIDNTKATGFGSMLRDNIVFAFGASEELANRAAQSPVTSPPVSYAWQLRYDTDPIATGGAASAVNAGIYYLGFNTSGLVTPFTSVLGFSGSEASIGGGKLVVPFGGIFGTLGATARSWQYVSSIPTSGTVSVGDVFWNNGTGVGTTAPLGWVTTTAGTVGSSALLTPIQIPRTGFVTLSGGTVTVTIPGITANSRIFLTGQDNNVTGALRVSARVTSGTTSFTVTSSVSGDSGVVAYSVVEP